MIILIAGASHTGKTLLAQRLLERYHFPYLSIDHLKMGLIRSGNTLLTPMDDGLLTDYLWPIVREMIKTAIENGQNLTVEGCYIPFDWKKDFTPEYLCHIRYRCLIMSRRYTQEHFADIRGYGNAIEQRLDDSGLSMDTLIRENEENLQRCQQQALDYILLDEAYRIDLEDVVGKLQLVRAVATDAEKILAMQQEAFAQLLERYQDQDMSPATESLEKIRRKITHPDSYYYLILAEGQVAGGIRVVAPTDGSRKRISPLYILPAHRGKGYAQAAMKEAEHIHGSHHWQLDTIAQEAGNCYLYEKMGYHQTGRRTFIKENMTIVDYEKD